VLRDVDPRVRPGMTANVKIPVASAASVTSVPLAAVFTEKNPETLQMERFVYVKQDEAYEKRNVKVGVSDFFFAEIQEGLTQGEVVSLEVPKEELEKKTHQLASQRPATEIGALATKPATPVGGNTNTASSGSGGTAIESGLKALPPATQPRAGAAGKS